MDSRYKDSRCEEVGGRLALKIGRRLTSKIGGRWDWREVGGGIDGKWEVGGGIGGKWEVVLVGSGRWTRKMIGGGKLAPKTGERWEVAATPIKHMVSHHVCSVINDGLS